MTWFGWVLIGWFALGAALNILTIGKQGKLVSPGAVLGTCAALVALTIGVLAVGTGHL